MMDAKSIEQIGIDFESKATELMKSAPNKLDARKFIDNVKDAIKNMDTKRVNEEMDKYQKKLLCQQ